MGGGGLCALWLVIWSVRNGWYFVLSSLIVSRPEKQISACRPAGCNAEATAGFTKTLCYKYFNINKQAMACIILSHVLTSANIVVNVGRCTLTARHPDILNTWIVHYPPCQKAHIYVLKIILLANMSRISLILHSGLLWLLNIFLFFVI